ncbi:hypothetical protein [Streptomyces phaeochromogenes]
MLSGDVEQAATYGFADTAQVFVEQGLGVKLLHRDVGRAVVER